MRPRAFDPWPKLSHNEQIRLRAIVTGGPMGVPAGADHAPTTTLELQRKGFVSVTLGRAYANEKGREWVEAHPVAPAEAGGKIATRRAVAAKTVTMTNVDWMRLTAEDVIGVLPNRNQMTRILAAGGLVVA